MGNELIKPKQYENAIVKYNNNLCDVNLGNLTNHGLNMLMAILLKVAPQVNSLDGKFYEQQMNQGSFSTSFSFDELRAVLNLTTRECNNIDFSAKLENMSEGLASTRCSVQDGSAKVLFQLFPTFIADYETKTLNIEINRCFQYLLTDVSRRFTIFQICEFLSLKSKYEKILYMHIRRNRGLGKFECNDLDTFKNYMGIDTDYKNSFFIRDIIKPAVAGLKKVIPSLELTTMKDGKSHRLVGFTLTFNSDKEDLKGIADSNILIQDNIGAIVETKEQAVRVRASKPNVFSDFPQRKYTEQEYEEIEKKKLRENLIKSE